MSWTERDLSNGCGKREAFGSSLWVVPLGRPLGRSLGRSFGSSLGSLLSCSRALVLAEVPLSASQRRACWSRTHVGAEATTSGASAKLGSWAKVGQGRPIWPNRFGKMQLQRANRWRELQMQKIGGFFQFRLNQSLTHFPNRKNVVKICFDLRSMQRDIRLTKSRRKSKESKESKENEKRTGPDLFRHVGHRHVLGDAEGEGKAEPLFLALHCEGHRRNE